MDAPACYARFLKHCEDYIGANIRQAELRERGEVLDLDAFIRLRRENSGVPICIGIIGFIRGRDIPDEVFEHPVMTRLYLAAVDMVWLSNVTFLPLLRFPAQSLSLEHQDIYSYNREQAIGLEGDNFLTLLMTLEKCDLQRAADIAGRRFAELVANFEADRARLPSWGPDLDITAAKFVEGLEAWATGNCQWSLETQRYFGAQVGTVKHTLVVKLDRKRVVDEVGIDLSLRALRELTTSTPLYRRKVQLMPRLNQCRPVPCQELEPQCNAYSR